MNYFKDIKAEYSRIHGINTILYTPEKESDRKHTALVVMHTDADYLDFVAGRALAERGFTALCANIKHPENLDEKFLDVKTCMEYVKTLPWVRKIVLLGHSGGATLMSGYQAIAENGAGIFQGPEKIIPCPDMPSLPKADGIYLLDSNWGNGVMTLLSVDPTVTDNASGLGTDLSLDLANPANGYEQGNIRYTQEFIESYQKAQGIRNNQIVELAVERLKAIEEGKGLYTDDEPFCIAGASQIGPNNRMFPQDIRLMNHTKEAWPLIHADGCITNEIVHTKRLPRDAKNNTPSFGRGGVLSTVKRYLTNNAVRALPDYSYDESGLYGVDWDSSWCVTCGNVVHIHVPALIMGFTGSYEFLTAETIYNRIGSEDKTMAFVEGAGHNALPNTDAESFPGEFGDTVKLCFDYAAQWLDSRF